MVELVARWPSAVGEQIARNAWPARIGRDGKLHVATSSSAWAFELTSLGAAVLERLRAALGNEAPSSVAFAPGPVPEVLAEAARPARHALRIGPAERSRAAELTASMSNEELRLCATNALAAGLSRAADDR